jgi:Skp family chaperone for outer membrane proteins
MINCFVCSSTSARFESASLTLVASSLAFSKRAAFSAPHAAPTDLDKRFCSARNVSNLSNATRRIFEMHVPHQGVHAGT